MAGKELLTRNCKRCDSQFITTDPRKVFCNNSCASKYTSMRAYTQKDKKRHREYKREYELKRNYGITLDDYNRMFEEQNGCCALCETHQSELKQTLSVDHCHKTEKVRKLLCQKCNQGLGLFNDDPDLLKKAAEYVSWPAKL